MESYAKTLKHLRATTAFFDQYDDLTKSQRRLRKICDESACLIAHSIRLIKFVSREDPELLEEFMEEEEE
jgi:hypothetical protein